MTRTFFRLALASVLAALPIAYAGAAPMTPGMWVMEMSIEAKGPSQAMEPVRECVSKEDIDHPTKSLPRPDGKCTLSNVQRSDERAGYDIACMNGPVVAQGHADILYGGDRYDGTVTMTVNDHGEIGAPITMRIKARRVGACNK